MDGVSKISIAGRGGDPDEEIYVTREHRDGKELTRIEHFLDDEPLGRIVISHTALTLLTVILNNRTEQRDRSHADQQS